VIVDVETVAAISVVKTEAIDEMASEAVKVDAIEPSNRATPFSTLKAETILNPFTKLHQAATHGHRGGPATEGDKLAPVDAARFIGRVARAFHAAQERGGMLQLRLSPPELGALRLELVVKDGVLAATLETETPAARRVLLDHLPALRDRLIEQNIRIERFDVDVRRDGGGGQQAPTPQYQQQREHQSHSTPPRNPIARIDRGEETTVPTAGVRVSDSQINLVV
jgi:flagellar hook-length control protein FliK